MYIAREIYARALNKHCIQPYEVNWLDSELERDSSDYEDYIDDLHEIDRLVDFYIGFHSPPTAEEFSRRWVAEGYELV